MAKFQPIPLSASYPSPANCVSCDGEDGLHLYVSNARVVDLPEEGTITFRYRRGPVTLVEAIRDLEGRASVDLTLLEITAVKGELSEEYVNQAEGAIDKLFDEARKSDEGDE